MAGGLGDCGLFLPIAIAMITLNGLNATAVFVGVGAIYVATALYFRVPVPVQPLKAFAAAAIALNLGPEVLAAGALLMALIIGVLGASGLAGWLSARFPLVLVRGIQAAVALLLLKAAVSLAERGNWEGLPAIDPLLSGAIALGAFIALVLARNRSLPASLIVLGAGALVGVLAGSLPDGVGLGAQPVSLAVPDGAAFATALTALVIAQIPLTFGNAVVATCDAERQYFGERASRVVPNRISASIAAGNVIGGLSGGMPVCHGAGGATAHYSMGARSGRATVAAGVIFIGAGLLLGASLPAVLMVLAPGALAGMLAFVAFEHGLLAARLERLDDRLIAATVGVVTLLAGNLAVGFGVGVALVLLRRALGGAPVATAESPA
ncbi:MAG: molybdate transporter family protein [Solirubrobacterales bacterium]